MRGIYFGKKNTVYAKVACTVHAHYLDSIASNHLLGELINLAHARYLTRANDGGDVILFEKLD